MKRITFVLGLLCGVALLGVFHGGWIARAALSFLLLGGFSVAMFFPREWYIRRIDTTNGNDIGLIAAIFYVIASVIATLVATVAAAFVPHTGTINVWAMVGVVIAAFFTARMHGK
jgi:hypothetical protein